MEAYNHTSFAQYLVKHLSLFENHPEDSLFFATNSDTLLAISNRLSAINFPCLVAIDGRDSDFSDNNAEMLVKKPQYFFMLLMPADDDDPQAVLDAQALCETNAEQIIALMLLKKSKFVEGFTMLVNDSFLIRSVGPVGENLFGVILGFNVEHAFDRVLKPDFWV